MKRKHPKGRNWPTGLAQAWPELQVLAVLRDESGKLSLSLRGRPEKLAVGRLYAHLFRAM